MRGHGYHRLQSPQKAGSATQNHPFRTFHVDVDQVWGNALGIAILVERQLEPS
jgi:hypothetical protein